MTFQEFLKQRGYGTLNQLAPGELVMMEMLYELKMLREDLRRESKHTRHTIVFKDLTAP